MSSKDISLKPEVVDLASKIKAGIKLDGKTGIGAEEGNLYEANLPESITPEIVKTISDFNSTFVAAGAFAFGELAVDAMKGNKDLERASVDIAMGGKDTLSLNVDRRKTFPNHLGGGGETEKFGIVSASYEVIAGKNAGQLKKARTLIGEIALDSLK